MLSALVTRTPEDANFCWGLLIVTAENGKAIEISYSDARSLATFSGVSYCGNSERVYMFDYDTKEIEHQNTGQSDYYAPARTNQIASCFDALSITYCILENLYDGLVASLNNFKYPFLYTHRQNLN
jgi:hypothetical protein